LLDAAGEQGVDDQQNLAVVQRLDVRIERCSSIDERLACVDQPVRVRAGGSTAPSVTRETGVDPSIRASVSRVGAPLFRSVPVVAIAPSAASPGAVAAVVAAPTLSPKAVRAIGARFERVFTRHHRDAAEQHE
jgi:hypothetical protein